MSRANITFSLKDTSEDDMMCALSAALGGDLTVARDMGAEVEVLPDFPIGSEGEADEDAAVDAVPQSEASRRDGN